MPQTSLDFFGARAVVASAWNGFTTDAKRWMKVVEGRGPAEVERIYRELLAGKTAPDVGYVVGLSA